MTLENIFNIYDHCFSVALLTKADLCVNMYYGGIFVNRIIKGEIMIASGFVRKLDELGRIVLPIEIRKTFQIRERDPLEIFVDNDKIILKKYEPGDIFTGELDDLVEYKGRKFSRTTIEDLAKQAGFEVTRKS